MTVNVEILAVEATLLEYNEIAVQEVIACTCDRCQRRMLPYDDEWFEKLSIVYRGSRDSIFGFGKSIAIDLCQQCVKETLDAWLRIGPSPSGFECE